MKVIHHILIIQSIQKYNIVSCFNPQRELNLYSSLQKFLLILYSLLIILFIKCLSCCCALYYLTICFKDFSILRHTDLFHLLKGCPGFLCVLILADLPSPEQGQVLNLPDPKAEHVSSVPQCLENQRPLPKFNK